MFSRLQTLVHGAFTKLLNLEQGDTHWNKKKYPDFKLSEKRFPLTLWDECCGRKSMIKVLCEQTREANKRIKIFFWIMFNIIWFWEYCGWFSCLEYEEINQQKILIRLEPAELSEVL